MKNVSITVSDDNIMNIAVDLNKTFGKSKSGKTTIIGTTEGNQQVANIDDEKVIIGLNVYKY